MTETKEEYDLSIKFGGGQNSSASEDDVNDRECSEGENFSLDLRNRNLINRAPFDKIGIVPNAGEIRGFVSLKKRDGTLSFLVQAEDKVYSWTQAGGFVSKGSVSPNAKLRGRLEHYWQLDDLVLITDLEKSQPVMSWNGTTLTNITHNLVGSFYAKYCYVANERAHFGNVTSGTDTPQLLVISELGDYGSLSTTDRPTTSIGEGDPCFLTTLDLRPINGLEQAFGVVIISSEMGDIMRLSGVTSQNFLLEGFAPRTGATGDESVRFVGNDIIYGRLGRIESISATDTYGDVEQNDLSLEIKDAVESFNSWSLVYNARTQDVYCYPGNSQVWLYKKSLRGSGISPWSKYTTQDSFGFEITAMMNALDPDDGLEYTFFGDSSGNVYRMEGTGEGDSGATSIKTRWRSKLFSLPRDYAGQDFIGFVKHKVITPENITIRLLQNGTSISNQEFTVTLASPGDSNYFGGNVYFGGEYYFGTQFEGRFARIPITPPGKAEDFQIEVEYEGTGRIEINEIQFTFAGAN